MNYEIVISDPFERDRDAQFLAHARRDPPYAGLWYDALTQAIDALTGFPGPLSYARDEEASSLYGREVRRLLYYGPTRRRTGTPARLLFTLLPPAEDDPDGDTAIFLLRLLHGPQSLLSPDPAPESL